MRLALVLGVSLVRADRTWLIAPAPQDDMVMIMKTVVVCHCYFAVMLGHLQRG